MPENIEGLLDAFGVSQDDADTGSDANNQNSNPDSTANNAGDSTDPGTNNVNDGFKEPDEADSDDGDANNNTNDDTAAAEQRLETERANRAFAAMRAENNKYKNFMKTLMQGSNYAGDEASFIEALTNEAYKKRAKEQGMAMNPEILRKVDEQEAQIRRLNESQRDQALLLGLKNLQTSNNLTGKEVEDFVKGAVDNRIDLFAPGVNYEMLYRGMFYDKLVEKKIEEERQKWIEQSNKSNNASTPDSKSGRKDPAKTDVKTMTELDSLLKNVSKQIN